MSHKIKRRSVTENGDGGAELGLATSIGNGENLGPIVRLAFEAGKQEALVNHLKNIAKKKELEVEELCNLHYEEFILSIDELRKILSDAYELKSRLSDENLLLQEVASSLLSKLDELLEMYSVKKKISAAIQKLKICIDVLNLCLKCNQKIGDNRLYLALNTLGLIEKDSLQKIPAKALKKVFGKQIPAIKKYIEKKVSADFADWLVYIREKAREIGQLAIGQAASARQKDEEILLKQIESEEQSHSGFNDFIYTLETAEETDEESIIEFELSPVYRAYNIHTCLGLGDRFHDCYYTNRLLQLNLDLQISTEQPFLEFHQSFLAQIAGCFIVEDRVLRTVAGLLSENQVGSLWGVAIAKMKTVLEDQFHHIDTASHLLLIKDSVTLLVMALRRYGYQVTDLLDVIYNSRDKYHELLIHDCQKQIAEFLANDTYEQVVIRKEYEFDMYVLSFHLQDSDMVPEFPYVALFSSSVPDICRLVRSFIEDSVSYLSYGGQSNFSEAVGKYLDKLLVDVLNEALLRMIHGGILDISRALQTVANIAILERACGFFLRHVARLCGIPFRLFEKLHAGLTARTVLNASKNDALHVLSGLVNSKLDELMALMGMVNWMADEPPDHENEYVDEVVIYVDSFLSKAEQILPAESFVKVGTCVLEHISDSIIDTFLSEKVKKFNLNAVIGIDNDLKILESFVNDRLQGLGLNDLKEGNSLRDCFVEARQLINLFLSNQPESFMNPAEREENYGALDYKKVAAICEKFKDSSETLFGSLSSRSYKPTARKKSMDFLKRRLMKDF